MELRRPQEQSSRLILQPEVSRAAFDTLLAMVRKNGAAAVVFETACVLAATLFDLDPPGAAFEFPVSFEHVRPSRQSLAEERLSPATARRLQELAWQAVAARERSPVAAR